MRVKQLVQAVPAACRSLCSLMRTYMGSFKVSRARPVLGCEGPSTLGMKRNHCINAPAVKLFISILYSTQNLPLYQTFNLRSRLFSAYL